MTSDETSAASSEPEEDADLIGRVWYQHGLFCATHPRLVIFFTALVIFVCSAPLFSVPLFGGLATIEWITLSSSGVSVADSQGQTNKLFQGNDTTIQRWFVGDPLLYVQQFVMTVQVSPWRPDLQSNEVIREALKPAFLMTNSIREFQHQQSGEYVKLSDVCLHVTSGPSIRERSGLGLQDGKYLPASGCLLLSPANLWNQSLVSFENDFKILDDLYQEHGRPAFNIALKEFIFGLPLKKTGMYPDVSRKHGLTEHTIRYAVTLMLTSHYQGYMDALGEHLRSTFPLATSGANGQEGESKKGHVVNVYYKGEGSGGGYVEFFPVCAAYFIVFLYLAFSVSKIEMVKSKWGLAFSAMLTVVASLFMAAGLCSFFGLVPTLNSSEVFPYLVIVIGVENILVITKSVVSTPVDLDVKFRVAQGLKKEGRYILKNLVTEITILLSGYFTFVPAIQEFCLFAVVGLSTDFFLQMVFFATVLSIDIRRMDLSDLSRQRSVSQGAPAGAQHMVPNQPSQQPVGQTRPSPLSWFRILPPLPSESRMEQCPVMPRKLPKRLNFAYMWARTRIVQRALMVCAVLYFLYVVTHPGTGVPDTTAHGQETSELSKLLQDTVPPVRTDSHKAGSAEDASSPGGVNMLFNRQGEDMTGEKRLPEGGGKRVTQEDTEQGKAQFSIKPPSEELWKNLYKRHWPQLLSYYDISLLGRYISILPPVHLGSHVDTAMIVSKAVKRDPSLAAPDGARSPRDSASDDRLELDATGSGDGLGPESGDRRYYLNAFYCLVLALVVMVLLFFVCKFLNECQINPRAYRKRRRTAFGPDDLLESVPISLKGQAQLCLCSVGNVEHVKCTMSFIVSVCLSGQIRIWDMSTGKCLREVHRNSPEGLHSPRQGGHSRRRARRRILATDDGGYTKRWFRSLEDGPAHEQPGAEQSTSGSDNFNQVGSEEAENGTSPASALAIHRSGSDESVHSAKSGYDFEPFALRAGLGTWSPRLNSPVSPDSSLSSDSEEEEEIDWASSSEVSLEERTSLKSGNVSCYHGSTRPAPAVWCMDCQEDLLVSGCSNGVVEVWNISSGRQLDAFADGHQGVTKLSFLPKTAHVVVVARLDGSLDVLSLGVSSGHHLVALATEGSPVRRSSPRNTRKIPPAGPEPVGASSQPTLTTSTVCSLLHRVSAHHQPINFLCVTDGWFITGSHDRTLKVFRAADQFVCRFTLHGHRAGITALALDETTPHVILSGAENGGVRVWNFVSGECLQHLRGHVKAVTAVTCTAKHLLSVSLDSVTCIWLRARGVCLHRIRQFPDLYSNVAMLSSNLFVTGGRGCLQVWDLVSGKRVRTIPLGDDGSVFVRRVRVRDNATVVCDYGKELRMVSFPGIVNKAE